MAYIVSIGAGDKGELLLRQWQASAHETSDEAAHLPDAAVVLLDANGADVDIQQIAPKLAGKIVIECSNASSIDELGPHRSNAEEVARRCPDARVVKALNVPDTAALHFALHQKGPSVGGTYTSAYYCGEDAEAKQIVAGLLSEIALDPIDCGPLANAILLESLGVLTQYLEKNVFDRPFSLVVARQGAERSPLDRWM